MIRTIGFISIFSVFCVHSVNAQTTDSSLEILSLSSAPDTQKHELKLEESIQIAIESATNVLKSKSDVELNGSALLKSYVQFLPNLTTQNNYNYSTGTIYDTAGAPSLITGKGRSATLSVTSDFNIFNGFSDYAALQSSLLRKDSSELTLARVKQQIGLDAAQSFLQVILDNKIVEIAQKNLTESQTRERLLSEEKRLGAASTADLYFQQAQTSQAESFLQTAQNTARTDQLILLQKLRIDTRSHYYFVEPTLDPDAEEKSFSDENYLAEMALKKRLDLEATDKLVAAANYDMTNAASGYLPKIDFVANATSAGSILNTQTVNGVNVVPASQDNMGNQLKDQIKYTYGINFTWEIFDRFVTYENRSELATTAYKLKLDDEDLKNQVISDARQAYSSYKLALQQLETSRKGLDAAQKAYEVMAGRYRLGSASFVDLITAQSTLVQAETSRAQALVNFKMGYWNVKYAIGDLEF